MALPRTDSPHHPRKPAIVEGTPLRETACPECLAMTVIETYRHVDVRLLFCTSCERTWTTQ